MEEKEINSRIKSLILYSDSVERSDMPVELKREKLDEIEREKIFLENILDDRKFKQFLREYIIGIVIVAFVSCLLMLLMVI
jgi:hypothetical protein